LSESIDPTRATSPAFNRRTFVSLSAGAASFGSTAATGLAAPAPAYGKPHDPIVSENDSDIEVLRLQLPYPWRGSSRILDTYVARPKNQRATTPGVVVVQAIWGVDAQLRDVVRRLAKEGYAAIAPDLYSGLGAPSGDGVSDFSIFRPFGAKLDDETVDHDILQCANWIRRQGKPDAHAGVLGFCMGGGIALRQAVDNAPAFRAAAVFYGQVRYTADSNAGPIVPIDIAYANALDVPVLGSWGGRDTSILPADVHALDDRLTGLNKPHDFVIYDEAGHAFFDDTRASYVASAADDAWTRTLYWFHRFLP